MRQLVILIAGSLLVWVALVYPARRLGGDQGVFLSAVALALCLVPATVTMAWAIRTANRDSQFLVILAGTGVRMSVVLGGGLFLHQTLPEEFPDAFWVWLLVFYIVILSLEMTLLVKRPTTAEQNSLKKLSGAPRSTEDSPAGLNG